MEEKKNVTFVPDIKILESAQKAIKKRKPTRKLIFLIGFKNTGKDTVADLIKGISTEPVVQVAFADALKTEFYPTLGVQYSRGTEDRQWKDDHRSEIIRYGESQKYENGMYYWVKRALDGVLTQAYEKDSQIPHVIVTDCRRVEEIMWFKHFKLNHFKELEGARDIYDPLLFAVHREGMNDEDKDYLTHIAVEYAIETRTVDRLIKNYGTIEQLKQILTDIYAIKIR